MIKKLTLNNFLSHRNTTLDFSPGVTVFVGHNGSGKSSIIDSITFALFNEHTRKSNKNLISKGFGGIKSNETGAYVIMDFSINSINYKIKRHIDNLGHLLSVKLEQSTNKKDELRSTTNYIQSPLQYRTIITGERKQLGESVIHEIESLFGINYQKMQIASIIQQGEISRIIDSQPKEFKELLNNMIGLDRLDKSFNSMYNIITDFRTKLREKINGYDDSHIEMLTKKVEQNNVKLAESKITLENIYQEIQKKTNEILQLEEEISILEPNLRKIEEIKTLENSLLRYFKEKSTIIKTEIDKISKVISDIKYCVPILKDKDEILITVQMVQTEKEELNRSLNKLEGEIGKLDGLKDCAKKIQIKDGRCPVCNSSISSLNHMFDIAHIQSTLNEKIVEKRAKQTELSKLNKEETELRKKERNIISAEKTLLANNMNIDSDVDLLENQCAELKTDYQKLSKLNFHNQFARAEDLTFFKIDDYSSNLIDIIVGLRREMVNFDPEIIQQKKLKKNSISSKLLGLQNQKAILEKTIIDMESENDKYGKLIEELSNAAVFISNLEKIRSMVFNRDGTVSASLRTWALNLISIKASEYISTFDVGISKISLLDKPREIKIICYGNRGEIDTLSLSGGEKVAVSLAIRLGIAYLMGSSKIDFIILDEPTNNLDEERRKSFVKIISDIFSKGLGPLSQIIIITHDEEIFENSEIEQVYKFAIGDNGSIVTAV